MNHCYIHMGWMNHCHQCDRTDDCLLSIWCQCRFANSYGTNWHGQFAIVEFVYAALFSIGIIVVVVIVVVGFGWGRHFIHVAEFAEFITLALNGAVIAKQCAKFATSAAQVFIVFQHMIASKCDDCVDFWVVCIFWYALEQVFVQFQELGPFVALASKRWRWWWQFAQIGAV